MADRKGSVFRRRLRSAERLSERAIARELSRENTPLSRSSASLVAVTRWDHRRFFFVTAMRVTSFPKHKIFTAEEQCAIFPVCANFPSYQRNDCDFTEQFELTTKITKVTKNLYNKSLTFVVFAPFVVIISPLLWVRLCRRGVNCAVEFSSIFRIRQTGFSFCHCVLGWLRR
jgi:hypothetical protein